MPVRVARSPISLTEPLRRLSAVLLVTMALAAAALPAQAAAQSPVTADVETPPQQAGREDPAPDETPSQSQTEALEELIDDRGDRSIDDPAVPSADAPRDPTLVPPEDWEDQTDVPRHHRPGSCEQLHPDHAEPVDAEAVDWAREQIEETVCGATLWFDGLFGENRNLDAARGAYGRLETSYEHSEFYGAKARTRFRLRVDLPNLQERASVFIGRDNDDDFIKDRSEGFALRSEFPQIDDRDKFFAGFGYGLPSNRRFRSDVKVGVRNVTNTRAFLQWRTEYLAYVDEVNLVQFRLTPFYSTRDGLGVTPGVDFSRVLTPRLLARWSNVGTHSDTTLGFDWRSAAVLYQGFGWQRGLAYEAFIRGVTETPVKLREFGLRLVYRQPIVGGRLYLQPLVGYSWPKEEPGIKREGAYLVGVGLELPYGKNPRRAIAQRNERRRADADRDADADVNAGQAETETETEAEAEAEFQAPREGDTLQPGASPARNPAP